MNFIDGKIQRYLRFCTRKMVSAQKDEMSYRELLLAAKKSADFFY